MKKWLGIILIALLSLNAYAGDGPALTHIDNLTVADLSHFQESKMAFFTSHPGKQSGNCRLIIRSGYGNDMSRFTERFDVQTFRLKPAVLDKSIPGALVFRLKAGSTMDGVVIQTKDGRSIADNVAAAFGPFSDTVGVLVGICHKLPPRST